MQSTQYMNTSLIRSRLGTSVHSIECLVLSSLFETIRYYSWLFAVLGDYSGFITSPSKIGVAKNMRGVLRKWKPRGIFQI